MAEASLRVLQISDLHYPGRPPDLHAMLAAVRAQIEALDPAVIVCSGDLCEDGVISPRNLREVKTALDSLDRPVFCIPGNHDVGNLPGVDARPLTAAHVDRWVKIFGGDMFACRLPGWRLLGVNSQVAGSSLDREHRQYAWLAKQLEQADEANEQAAVFLHTPPYLHSEQEPESSTEPWAMPPRPRARWVRLLQHARVRLVGHGHLHSFSSTPRGRANWVSCPSLNFAVERSEFPPGGRFTGMVLHELNESGASTRTTRTEPLQATHWADQPVVAPVGETPFRIADVVLQASAAQGVNGQLMPGVAERLRVLAMQVRISLVCDEQTAGVVESNHALPVYVHRLESGAVRGRFVEQLGGDHAAVIGCARGDADMLQKARLAFVVVGPMGASTELVPMADLMTPDARDALDLLLNPARLSSALRR